MTRIRSRLTSGFAAGFLGLASLGGLSACGDDEKDQTQGSGTQASGSSSEQPPAGDDTSDDTTDQTTDATTDGDSGDDADTAQGASPTGCLVGTWLADNQQLGALFKSAAAGTESAGAVSDPTGTVLVTFGADGAYRVNYEAWTMVLSQQGTTIDLVREGTDEGSYDADDDGTVEWTEVTMGSVVSMKTPAGTRQVTSEPSSTAGTFTCENDTLEVTAEGSTSLLQRQ